MVDAALREVLRDLLLEKEIVNGEAAAEVGAIRNRVLLEIRPDLRRDGNGRRACEDSLPRLCVRNRRRDRLSQSFPQRLVSQEEERAVALDWPANRAAELVPFKLGLAGGVEKVARVEVVVAVELVQAAVPSAT